MATHCLIELENGWPRYDPAPEPVQIPLAEYEERLEQLRHEMRGAGLTHLAVYGDREHCANLLWACGFDPRFEEALLILRESEATPLLLVGNECAAYVAISPLWQAGQMRSETYQPFSLLDQPRDTSRTLEEIFASEGIGRQARVGCVGWKYLDLPAYLVDALREAAGAVVNATAIFTGKRSRCSAAEIALFEGYNWKASEAMRRVTFSARVGMTDFEMLSHAGYDGSPLSCHMTLKTGPKRVSLASPSGARVERGYPWSANIAYWGANICRANWVAECAEDLPAQARDYVAAFAGPYFEAMGAWLAALRIGVEGGALWELIRKRLPLETFGIFLNPGHLIHYDEWVGSPIYEHSRDPILPGMVLQTDVIPSSKQYFSTRMEDGLAIADEALREELAARFPAVMARIDARREFVRAVLGLPMAPEHLPLSNTFGIVAPFLLRPNLVFALR